MHELYYEDSGGDGPAVVLGHGFLMDHTMFAPQVEALAPEFRVITWDERGHGRTRAGGPFTYWDSARDTLDLLDHLGIDRAFVGGMSQGGFIALRVALLAPERVAGLVLIDTQAGPEDPAAIPAYEIMWQEWVAHGPAKVRDAVATLILGEGVDRQPWYDKWAQLDPDDFGHAFRCLVEHEDVSDRLGEILVPALVLHGEADLAIPLAKGRAVCEGLARCEGMVEIPGAPHAANLSHPAACNGAILEFLRRHGNLPDGGGV